MFRVIESYDTSDATLTVEGRSFSWCCLVEDAEGVRWYLSGEPETVSVPLWLRAAASGAAALLSPRPQGGYLALLSAVFMDTRQEHGQQYLPTGWRTFADLPSYADLMADPVPPPAGSGFVHLHNHSDFSTLDGVSTPQEIAQVVAAQGGFAVGIADHGHCAGHPDFQAACNAAGLQPIFGMEAYLVENRKPRLADFTLPAGLEPTSEEATGLRESFKETLRDYYHLVLFAVDDVGLRNLWAMSTESYLDGLYNGHARLDWDILSRYSEGVIATSACLRGPLTHHGLLEGDERAALHQLGRLLEIFGDRFYIELHTNQLPEQVRVNEQLVAMATDYGLPLVAVVDSHYPSKEDREAHRVWLSMQTNKDVADDSTLFAGGQDYHLMTEQEVRDALAYLPSEVVEQAIATTATLAHRCTARIRGEATAPVFSKKGGHEADADKLLALCLDHWSKTLGTSRPQSDYVAYFEHEFPMLVRKRYCGYYLMWAQIVGYAKANGVLVGPGRGSGGASLAAYLTGITDLDPVELDLPFDRFMTEGRISLPDFDVDFPASKKRLIQDFVRQHFGEDQATVVGSVIRLKNKGIINKLGSALKSTLPENFYLEQKEISEIIGQAEADTAGLGLSWEDLQDKVGDQLAPYRARYPDLFALADRLVNRISTFGQHAAGMVITTAGALTTELPLRRAEEEGHLIAQWDKDVLEDLGWVKFDMLTLRNLDVIQGCLDLIQRRWGRTIDIYAWREEYLDPQVWEEIANGHTLGVFQIETQLGTQYAKRMRPASLADLADLVTIVRPGPRNSGLTETYLRRRDGLEEVSFPDPRLAQVLSKTHGAMLYQEDIMATCKLLAGYDSTEADEVRKILGKKKVELVAPAGQKFVTRAVERGMSASVAEALWLQMGEFGRYAFGRAHAYAYAKLAFWTAWFRVHYPIEFLTTELSSVDNDRIPVFIKDARRMGFAIQPPDINESGVGFTAGVLSVRYGLDSIKHIGAAAGYIQAAQPFTSFEDFMERCVTPTGSKVNRGQVALLAKVGAFDTLVPNRRGLEQVLLADKTGDSTRCTFKVDTIPVGVPHGLACVFDWASEEPPINPRTGKKMKPKPVVKRCTKACRNYTAPPPLQIADAQPYTAADIRQIEHELLGVYLSSTPYDLLNEQWREVTRECGQMMLSEPVPHGQYLIAGTLTKKRPHVDSAGREMGFVAFDTEFSEVDAVCFSSLWSTVRRDLVVGDFYAAEMERTSRGYTLLALMRYQS